MQALSIIANSYRIIRENRLIRERVIHSVDPDSEFRVSFYFCVKDPFGYI